MPTKEALRGREDVSRFLIHLTRDDRKDNKNGRTARRNLANILSEQKIRAFNPHCLFNRKIEKLDAKIADQFDVACFTEVPLNQVHLLTRSIEGRQIKMAPFGVVFTREFLIAAGAQPAMYINGYHSNSWLRQSVDALYDAGVVNAKLVEPQWRILPFLNAMHEKYDFTWEREWRVRGDLPFRPQELVCVILPEDGQDDFKEKLAEMGIATISPGWTYEQIVAELARQQRKTKKLARDALKDQLKADT